MTRMVYPARRCRPPRKSAGGWGVRRFQALCARTNAPQTPWPRPPLPKTAPSAQDHQFVVDSALGRPPGWQRPACAWWYQATPAPLCPPRHPPFARENSFAPKADRQPTAPIVFCVALANADQPFGVDRPERGSITHRVSIASESGIDRSIRRRRQSIAA